MTRVDALSMPGPQPRRLRFTVDDFYKLIEQGMVEDFERCEIIDGELVKKITIGDRHAATVNFLSRLFFGHLPADILVSIQNPLRLTDYDEPEPDIVLADLSKYDGRRHPTPAETLLVVEVADTTLAFDRGVRLPMYATALIPEVWIVNLQNDVIEVHTEPAYGIYQNTAIYQKGETAASKVMPEMLVAVNDVID